MQEPITIVNLVIAPGVRETTSEDGAVLLDIEQGVCFSLNPVGLKIWKLLQKGYSVNQVADALSQDFQMPRPQLISDTVEFIHALAEKQLVYCSSHVPVKQSWLSRVFSHAK
jgi:hypothetical protein